MLPGTGFIFCLNVQENGETAQEQRAEWGELFEQTHMMNLISERLL